MTHYLWQFNPSTDFAAVAAGWKTVVFKDLDVKLIEVPDTDAQGDVVPDDEQDAPLVEPMIRDPYDYDDDYSYWGDDSDDDDCGTASAPPAALPPLAAEVLKTELSSERETVVMYERYLVTAHAEVVKFTTKLANANERIRQYVLALGDGA